MVGEMSLKRPKRVAQLIQKEINAILQKQIKNAQLGFVTITEVKVTDDLQQAKVYFTVYGSEQEKISTEKLLKKMTSFVRYHVGQRISLRHTPEIVFQYDETIERAARIDELINKIQEERSNARGTQERKKEDNQ
ncbi:30S ribosome-binding factor RbfA [bacterium]|jgi:ribosome-binding factor A|nr:30S ribosome-binding factor RbfA [bacterium]